MTMHSPALAFGYGIWVRNQIGFLICAAGLVVMGLVYPLLFSFSVAPSTLIASTIPLIGIFSYVLNATIFAQEPGSLASSYPRHLLVMPVKSRSLVFWPMLFGSLIALLLLFVTVKVVYRSSGLAIPLGLPALALVVIVAWFQAIAWFPLEARFIRALIALFAALALGSLPIWIIVRFGQEAHFLVAAVLIAYLVAAYPLAFAALVAQRRGDSWQLWFSRERAGRSLGRAAHVRSRRPFRSATTAQFWYEWNCHGRAILTFLGFEMLMIWSIVLHARRPIDASLLPLILSLLLFSPIAVIGSSGPLIGRLRPFWVEQRSFNTFMIVRPIASAELVAAKLRLAVLVVISSWVFVLMGTSACVLFSRSLAAAITVWHRFVSHYPGGQAPAICVLACVLAPALMFRMLTDGMPFALTGRKWLADTVVCGYMVLIVCLGSAGVWVAQHPQYLPRIMAMAPWFVAFVAVLKAGGAAVAFRIALRWKLIDWREIRRIVATWAAFTVAVIAFVLLLSPPASLISKPSLFVGAASFVPLVRFPLSTLAVEWNRHR
jgi:hypothetical protein